MKKYILLLFTLILSLQLLAQLEVKEGSFKKVEGFVNINLDKQTDDNDQPYAVIKVKTENINDKQRHELNFQGDARTFFELEYRDGEVWVYISYYATFLKISHPDLSSTEFYFPYDLQPKNGYELILVNKSQTNIEEEKLKSRIEELETINKEMAEKTPEVVIVEKEPKGIFNFFTLNAAYSNYGDLSYGLTFGSYKKYGWFVSAMTNFNFDGFKSDYDCNSDLMVGTFYPNYSDKEYATILSIMGGFIYKLSEPIALRVGAGYGVRNTIYETTDGQLIKNADISSTGVDVSLGAMLKFGRFVVSLDAVTTNFKIFEAKLGIGFGVNR
jgi:hypothetical protein